MPWSSDIRQKKWCQKTQRQMKWRQMQQRWVEVGKWQRQVQESHTGKVQPRTQASSCYPSYQRRLRTECDSANFPDKLDRWRRIQNRRGRLGMRLGKAHKPHMPVEHVRGEKVYPRSCSFVWLLVGTWICKNTDCFAVYSFIGKQGCTFVEL